MTPTIPTNDETLVGATQEAFDKEASFLARLGNIALTDSVDNTRNYTSRNSRFWFRIETTSEFVASRKAKLAKKSIEHVDQQVEDRSKTFERDLTPKLKSHIEAVREFFLNEIAPLTFASSAGGMQAKSVAERLLDTEIDNAMFARFDGMVNRAATIKMANFVLNYFQLPQSQFDNLVFTKPKDPTTDLLQQVLSQMNSGPNHRRMTAEIAKGFDGIRQDLKKKSDR